jgi:hypothetical protein
MTITLKWQNTDNASTTVLTVGGISYTINVIYSQNVDITLGLEAEKWYGIITYDEVTRITPACIYRFQAKAESLKLLSDIEYDS